MPDFRPGRDLSAELYRAIRPLLRRPHAAALLGEGSEVLGYDSPRSADHNWTARLLVFTAPEHLAEVRAALVHGPDRLDGQPVRLTAHTVADWLTEQLGAHRGAPGWWLATPRQHLLQVTAGPVFADQTGELTAARRALAYYPRDVWLWLLAAQWHLVGNTEPLPGRLREAGDERGARLVAARMARLHNERGVTPPQDTTCRPFEVGIDGAVRPYLVLGAGRFVTACRDAIGDPGLRAMQPVGGIDQLTHADDAMINFTGWPRELADTYRRMLRS